MGISEHEITTAKPSFYSEEDGKPTLWDTPGPGRIPVAVLRSGYGALEISNTPEALELCAAYAETQ